MILDMGDIQRDAPTWATSKEMRLHGRHPKRCAFMGDKCYIINLTYLCSHS